jgi:hypothetical protein
MSKVTWTLNAQKVTNMKKTIVIAITLLSFVTPSTQAFFGYHEDPDYREHRGPVRTVVGGSTDAAADVLTFGASGRAARRRAQEAQPHRYHDDYDNDIDNDDD